MSAAACKSEPDAPTVTVDVQDPQDAGRDDAALGMTVVDTRCTITPAYLQARKRCDDDSDCALVHYRPTCCANVHIAGVAKDRADEVRECDEQGPPSCRCEDMPPNRADDGRATLDNAFADVVVACVAGSCRSSVTTRTCGAKKVCKSGDLCVAYGLVPGDPKPEPGSGDNAYLSYECIANPCEGALACGCAQAVCDAKTGVTRKCEIELNSDSDVACVPYRE